MPDDAFTSDYRRSRLKLPRHVCDDAINHLCTGSWRIGTGDSELIGLNKSDIRWLYKLADTETYDSEDGQEFDASLYPNNFFQRGSSTESDQGTDEDEDEDEDEESDEDFDGNPDYSSTGSSDMFSDENFDKELVEELIVLLDGESDEESEAESDQSEATLTLCQCQWVY
jgi:hypothetical protein